MQNHSIPLILASTSPRRRALITQLDAAFRFVSADVDEAPCDNELPSELVRRLSRAKAEIGGREARHALVIGADTIVWLDHTIIGKPKDVNDATRMLELLRARPHIVYSGVTVQQGTRSLTQVATTTVWMRDYSDAEIVAYVATGDPLDKAAAYAIQHNHFRPVARIDGCHANVMGLPLCHLFRALRAFGVALAEPDRACQAHLGIACPVARDVLNQDILPHA